MDNFKAKINRWDGGSNCRSQAVLREDAFNKALTLLNVSSVKDVRGTKVRFPNGESRAVVLDNLHGKRRGQIRFRVPKQFVPIMENGFDIQLQNGELYIIPSSRQIVDGPDGPGTRKTILESLNPYHRTTRKGRPGRERPQSRNPKEAKESLEAYGLQALQEFHGKDNVEDRTKERGFDFYVYRFGVLYAAYDTKNDSDIDRLSIFQYTEALRFFAMGVRVFTISRKRIKEWKVDTIWEPTGMRGYSPSELIA